MSVYEVVRTIIGIIALIALVIWFVADHNRHRSSTRAQCRNCCYLKQISPWGFHDCSKMAEYFIKPPKYCGYYKPRGDCSEK